MIYPKNTKPLVLAKASQAKAYFLTSESYFSGDLPEYINFGHMLSEVDKVLGGKSFWEFKSERPDKYPDVNYSLLANKDGRFAWRPFELINPAIYVSLVNLICAEDNWKIICDRFREFDQDLVVCCSLPVLPSGAQSQRAAQIQSWWLAVEQQSLALSLHYSHMIQTDVTNCYGAIYTHSIAWAIHGIEIAKNERKEKELLGNRIDRFIQAGRYGQTNGIPQGSALMDLIAELVLGYVDTLIVSEMRSTFSDSGDVRILRYRDDYRIFSNNDVDAEKCLKIVSQKLQSVGMHLGTSKTSLATGVIESAVKADKIAGIELEIANESSKLTLQKKLLILHAFGRRHPNSGSLRRLINDFGKIVRKIRRLPPDLEVQIAILVDIAYGSPTTFPGVAAILSHLISLAPRKNKLGYWRDIQKKMSRVPNNGFLHIWLQRVAKPKEIALDFQSDEPICKIVDGYEVPLWNNQWIASAKLKKAMDVKRILVADASESPEVIRPKEVELFGGIASDPM